jgi:hypothetical protein
MRNTDENGPKYGQNGSETWSGGLLLYPPGHSGSNLAEYSTETINAVVAPRVTHYIVVDLMVPSHYSQQCSIVH